MTQGDYFEDVPLELPTKSRDYTKYSEKAKSDISKYEDRMYWVFVRYITLFILFIATLTFAYLFYAGVLNFELPTVPKHK